MQYCENAIRFVLPKLVDAGYLRIIREDAEDVERYQATESFLKSMKVLPRETRITSPRRIAVLGESGVGKTTLLSRIVDRDFNVDEDTAKSIGVHHHHRKTVTYEKHRFMCVFWELNSERTYSELCKQYCRGAGGALFVFDTTRIETLENIDRWLVILHAGAGKVPVVIVENKTDLESQIPRRLVDSYVEKYDVDFIQMGMNDEDEILEKAFENLVSKILDLNPLHQS